MTEVDDENGNGTTVTVTSRGQATIPKEFRDKLHIDTPGRVQFVENDEGDVVVRPVKRPAEIRGALASAERDDETEGEREDEKLASETLREERERDKRKLDEKYGLSDE